MNFDEKWRLTDSKNPMNSKQKNTKKNIPKQIITNLMKPSDKQKILRAAREKSHYKKK